MHRIFNYRNPSKHLTMNAIQLYINTLQNQLINMPDGYVRETVQACLNLAQGIKTMYENTNNDLSNEPNQD